jgi:hypothetical protein
MILPKFISALWQLVLEVLGDGYSRSTIQVNGRQVAAPQWWAAAAAE